MKTASEMRPGRCAVFFIGSARDFQAISAATPCQTAAAINAVWKGAPSVTATPVIRDPTNPPAP